MGRRRTPREERVCREDQRPVRDPAREVRPPGRGGLATNGAQVRLGGEFCSSGRSMEALETASLRRERSWDPRQPCGCRPTTRLRFGQVTRPVKLRWTVGFGTTPPVATRSCGIGSSLPNWGSPDRLPARYRTVAGPPWRTSPRPLGPRSSRPWTATSWVAAAGSSPFAVACVVGELKRYLRDTTWRVHVPRPLKERTLQRCRTDDEPQQVLGRLPSTM